MLMFLIIQQRKVILISITKNETRGLQKEIDKLQTSIHLIKLDLHKKSLNGHIPKIIGQANQLRDFNLFKVSVHSVSL